MDRWKSTDISGYARGDEPHRPEKFKFMELSAGAQIDLVIDRSDDCITLCEIKYTQHKYVIDKKEASSLRDKIALFKERTKTRKTVFLSILSPDGVRHNEHTTGLVDNEVIVSNLFA